MAEVRSFNLRRTHKERAAIEFNIDEQETFHFYPDRVNGFVMMDMTAMAASQDSRPMWEFFELALGDDYDRFRTYVRSPEVDVLGTDMGELIEWMIEESSERPTTPPASSAGGRRRTSPGSTAT